MRKKLMVLFAATLLFMGLANLASAYDRTVLVEDHTNWGCGPCATPNATLHNVMVAYGEDQVFDIAYHMSWPSSNDPFYLANPADNNARRSYYNVNAVPAMWCDGFSMGTQQYQMESSINSRLAIPSHVWMDLDVTVSGNNLDIVCTTVSDVNITGNKAIHLVVLDRYTYLPASPNGNPHHYHAMLDMVPSSSGQAFTSTANDTAYWYGTSPMDPSWLVENLDVACFIQDNSNREILQAKVGQVPVDFPNLNYVEHVIEDDGNMDGRAEPGETASVYITLENGVSYQPATNVVATLSTTDPDLNFTTSVVNYPDVPNGSQATNTLPFVFEVDPAALPHYSTLNLEVVADPQATVMNYNIEIYIGWPDVLLIDDDGLGIIETYYQSALDNLSKSYENWDINELGTPTSAWVNQYPILIWLTGWATVDALNASEQVIVEDYLSAGGMLFLSGQNVAQGLTAIAPTYLQDVLHATLDAPSTGIKELTGMTGNPVGDGLTVDCNPGGAGSGTCTSPDGIQVLAPAEEAFSYDGSASYGALTYDHPSNGKLCFLAFPFEAINGLNTTNTREEVLTEIFTYFGQAPPPPPSWSIDTWLIGGSPVPSGGGNLDWGVLAENTSGQVLNGDVWIDAVYEGTTTIQVIERALVNYQPGWTINRPDNWYPVSAGWPGGNYQWFVRTGVLPNVVWEEDYFDWSKAGAVDLDFDFEANMPTASFPNPFDKIITNTAELIVPEAFEVIGAYPNPFNPTTNISFALPADAKVLLSVYDVNGRLVTTLVDGHRNAGVHDVTFNASDLASGIYLYRLEAGEFNVTGKMVLMK
ncbi:hypothetical protein CEE37_11315 [candidate division LCP-89 bacterium B3_LCP]|uniref:Secretion system C-terminal sorting domain-containing protein n=1 Tax=candidate division LCP-89 bacterium B3_LCP TaxID=2012998 RepID=A0A532UY83_UNCL8|nr:MAG: hypothetical protein CEE37_11315 [candidate division LCP-89 bacterium B3_LCP]